MSGLVIVDADQPGWKRIVPDQALAGLSRGVELDRGELDRAGPTAVLSQAFELRHADLAAVTQTIKPFLSAPGGTSFSIATADKKLLVVTDYADNLRRAGQLVDLMDQPGRKAAIRFVPASNLNAAELSQRASELLREKERIAAAGGKPAVELTLLAEPRTNQVAVVSADEQTAQEALELIRTLDVPSGAETVSYRLAHIAPQRIDKLARDFVAREPVKVEYSSIVDAESRTLIVTTLSRVHRQIEQFVRQFDLPSDAQTRTYRCAYVSPARIDNIVRSLAAQEQAAGDYRSTVDPEGGLLIVTASPAVHQRIEELKRSLDVSEPSASAPMAFYKLTNTTADQVLATIRALESGPGVRGGLSAVSRGQPAAGVPPRVQAWVGPNYPPGQPGAELPKPPGYRPSAGPSPGAASQPEGPGQLSAGTGGRLPEALVTADPNTNTVIVVAPPEAQRIYKQLIAMLDKRRPQVLIEAIIVTLDTSGGYSLGVEMAFQDTSGDKRRLLFSSFGLSAVDATTGAMTLKPGVGFNGVLIDPDTVDVVIRALASDGRAKVVSAPKVLVNDNATATLTSVNEAPFTSVNASDTVATTSFAGYASAGTTLTVTPHISEGDHLQLQYSVTLNSFTGEGSSTVPPPRQTNTIDSEVVVPDGNAVIVGGLTRKDLSESVSKIPILGDIPGIKYAFSNRTKNWSDSTLFVFIRPVILRDDQFEDLKYLSERELDQAGVPGNLPASCPLIVE